jgi:hypothetical protein
MWVALVDEGWTEGSERGETRAHLCKCAPLVPFGYALQCPLQRERHTRRRKAVITKLKGTPDRDSRGSKAGGTQRAWAAAPITWRALARPRNAKEGRNSSREPSAPPERERVDAMGGTGGTGKGWGT